MREAFQSVVRIHQTYGLPVAQRPQLLSDDQRSVRLALLEEELDELLGDEYCGD